MNIYQEDRHAVRVHPAEHVNPLQAVREAGQQAADEAGDGVGHPDDPHQLRQCYGRCEAETRPHTFVGTADGAHLWRCDLCGATHGADPDDGGGDA